MTPTSSRRRLLALGTLVCLPWSLLTYPGGVTAVFPWGIVNADPFHLTALHDYLLRYTAGLPEYILAWPVSVLCYLLALSSAAGGAVAGREDVRVTAGLLALAGAAHLSVAAGFAVQPGRAGYPTGTLALWAAAGWYWPLVRRRLGR